VIGFLRFVGVINVAIWLGGAVFLTFAGRPALFSPEMQSLLEAKNFPYFSGAIAQVVLERYYNFHVVCGVIAFMHLLAEWLYFGRPGRKLSFSLLIGLFVLTLIQGNWVQARMKAYHTTRYAVNVPAPERDAAAASFRSWESVWHLFNLLMIAGLTAHLWRVAHPSDNLRFVSSVKFRGGP
jgi:hypothetical protein